MALTSWTGLAELRHPWVPAAVAVGTVVLLAWWLRRGRRVPPGREVLWLAHTARLRRLPAFRRLRRRRLALVAVRVLGAVAVLAGAALLVARPTQTVTGDAVTPSRDVVLCLDASGSMADSNAAVLRAVGDVVDERRGDRIGIVLFNGASLTVLPLSDDYDAITRRLDSVAEAFTGQDVTYLFATQGNGLRVSQAGDGLVSCVQRFTDLDQERGRTVLLATDNAPLGPPIYTLEEAAAYAERRDVAVHAIAPAGLADDAGRRAELAGAARRTGGSLTLLDPGAEGAAGTPAEDALAGIARQEARRLDQPPRPRRLDDPAGAALACAAGAGLLLAACAGVPRRARRAR